MAGTPSYAERRRLGSVNVNVPRSTILELGGTQVDVVDPIALCGLDAAVTIRCSVLQDVHEFGDENDHIVINVEGVPDGADVLVHGSWTRLIRDWFDATTEFEATCEGTVDATLRGNGRLASYLLGYTESIRGTVAMYGPPLPKPVAGQGMDALRRQSAFCDVVLRVGDRDFPAHKVVLSSQSAVFLAMFTGDFREAADQHVDMTCTCSGAVFDAFLRYLYTGVLADFRSNYGDLVDLLDLSCHYMVDRLKEECVRQLLEVGVDGVLVVLRAALERPFVPVEVLGSAIKVVLDNWDSLADTQEWADLEETQRVGTLMLKGSLLVRRMQR